MNICLLVIQIFILSCFLQVSEGQNSTQPSSEPDKNVTTGPTDLAHPRVVPDSVILSPVKPGTVKRKKKKKGTKKGTTTTTTPVPVETSIVTTTTSTTTESTTTTVLITQSQNVTTNAKKTRANPWVLYTRRYWTGGPLNFVKNYLDKLKLSTPKYRESDSGEGRASRPMLVAGGTPATPYFYKSIVLVLTDGLPKCGGTILNKDWVMTAAHCIKPSPDPNRFSVVAAEYDLSIEEGPEQRVKVTEIIKHQDYDEVTDVNDIALFRVSPPFVFNSKVQPGILPSKDYKLKGKVRVVGWGATKDGAEKGNNILLKADLPFIKNDECQERYENFVITPNHICTLAKGGKKDACQGDSGGPLYHFIDKKQTVVGIVSWGVSCAHPDYPGVFTRVSSYLEWIHKHISLPGNSTTSKP